MAVSASKATYPGTGSRISGAGIRRMAIVQRHTGHHQQGGCAMMKVSCRVFLCREDGALCEVIYLYRDTSHKKRASG